MNHPEEKDILIVFNMTRNLWFQVVPVSESHVFIILTISLAGDVASFQTSTVTTDTRISRIWLTRYNNCVTTFSLPAFKRGRALSKTQPQNWGTVIWTYCKDCISSRSVSSCTISPPKSTLEACEEDLKIETISNVCNFVHIASKSQQQIQLTNMLLCEENILLLIEWTSDSCFCFVLDQQGELDFYSASWLKQQSMGKPIAPLGHIWVKQSLLLLLAMYLRWQVASTTFIVFGLTWPDLETHDTTLEMTTLSITTQAQSGLHVDIKYVILPVQHRKFSKKNQIGLLPLDNTLQHLLIGQL